MRAVLVILFLLFPVSALADGRGDWSPPQSQASMERWAQRKIDRLDDSRVDWVRETLPEFFFIHFTGPDYDPPIGATRTMDFDAKGVLGAILSLHDGRSGAFITSCRLPCRLATLPDTDYRLGITAPGHRSATRWLRANRSAQKPFSVTLDPNLWDYARNVWTCWSDHEAQGFPDTEATPCVRTPPKMPRKATRSGQCQMQFDVTAAGWTDNVRAVSCTDPIFERPSVRSVRDWYYVPETQRGQTVRRPGIQSQVTFRLMGVDGKVTGDDPLPGG